MSAPTVNGAEASKTSSSAALGSSSNKQAKNSNGGKALDHARKQAASPIEGQNRKQPQKAWQSGHNPITQTQTQRPSTNTPNGIEKPLPKLPSQPQAKSNGEPPVDKHSHDRLLFLLANMTGQDTTLTLKNGEQFSGIFSGGSFEASSKNHYVLKMVKRTKLPAHQQPNGVSHVPDEYIGEGEDHVMTFDVQDTVDLTAKDVNTAAASSAQNGSLAAIFRTDAEISGRDHQQPRQRELQRWEPAGGSSIDISLESSGTGGWDQFAENERLYGVTSNYDEDIYTTTIDKNNPLYKQREARAAKLAREIEGSAPDNAHVAEERRQDIDRGDGIDEEDKYSGVRRETAAASLPKRSAGSYIPPSQRPITNAPTVPGAPFDPAIISSQLAKPSSSAVVQEKSAAPVKAAAPSAEPSKPESQEKVSSPALPPQKTSERTTEDYVQGTLDSFKQFANNEKLRIRGLQEVKKSTQRHEKNVKLNDLKKFAANFKLKSRVPEDLVPILAKDPVKQQEIQREAEAQALKSEQTKKALEKAVTSPTASAVATPQGPGPVPPSDVRLSFSQQQPHTRNNNRMSTQPRNQMVTGHNQSSRQPHGQRLPQQHINPRVDLQIPPRRQIDRTPISPSTASAAATRLNVNARPFELRPGASDFTPSGASPSPHRAASTAGTTPSKPTVTYFGKLKQAGGEKTSKTLDEAANTIKWMQTHQYPDTWTKDMEGTDGVPPAWRTDVTWLLPAPAGEIGSPSLTCYKDHRDFQSRAPSHGISPMHTPSHSGPHLPPQHLQTNPSASHIAGPGRHQFYPPQPPGGQGPHFDPRMSAQFAPNGSVQSSPRFSHVQAAPFGSQVPVNQYPGQPMGPGYGVSPSIQYRQMHMPPGPQMMMMPNQPPGPIPQMRSNFAPSGQFPGAGGPQMGGQMMVHNPSSGPYIGGPVPQQQPYSPMPPHAQPHMGQHMQQQGSFGGSPRPPPMMQHQGSHQGFQPPNPMQHGMNGQQPIPQGPPQQFPHPYHYQQHGHGYQQGGRQLSSGHGGQHGQGGFPQMTPRQQNAVPSMQQQHASPGMGDMGRLGTVSGPTGDEGK